MQHLLALSRESLSKKAAYLRIVSNSLAESLKSGHFRSMTRGYGIEFSGVREYLRGDDVRSIDWNVTARMGKPFVKQFEEEKEFQMFLIVDRSSSMFTGSQGHIKYTSAAELAAVLVIAAELNEIPVGAVFFDGKIHFNCKPEFGRHQTMKLLSKLDEVEDVQNGSALKNAITGATCSLKRKSLVFVISDFRSTNWQESFKMLCQKHDVVAIRVTDDSEMELPDIGSVPFQDIETGEKRIYYTSNFSFKVAWKNAYKERIEKISKLCRKHKADFISITTEEDCVRTLSRYFESKGKL